MTIELPEEQKAVLSAKAQAKGLPAEDYVRKLLEFDLVPGWLQEAWGTSQQTGLDQLSAEEIDAEIAAPQQPSQSPSTTGTMTRVVLDTNILVSALPNPLGSSAQLFLLCLNGSLQLCLTGAIYAEYEEVISRPRFIECAEAAQASYVVTGNIRHFPSWAEARIVTPRWLLDILSSHQI